MVSMRSCAPGVLLVYSLRMYRVIALDLVKTVRTFVTCTPKPASARINKPYRIVHQHVKLGTWGLCVDYFTFVRVIAVDLVKNMQLLTCVLRNSNSFGQHGMFTLCSFA
jgi:hypothetical protein